MRPLLTIAIPTYNRSEYLKNSLDSIVNQNVFVDSYDLEVVVSDNCSCDDTENVCRYYLTKYEGKFFYYRNDENIADRNFEIVLKRSNGHYLKLSNDTLIYQDRSLEKMLSIIRMNQIERNIIFWGNGNLKVHSLVVDNLDTFVQQASYWSTWIGSFGIWKDEFDKINDFGRYSKLKLIQTDVLYRQIVRSKGIYLDNSKLFDVKGVKQKGDYNIVTVFIENYSMILREYLHNSISLRTYKVEMEKVLINFICEWLTNIKIYSEKFTFDTKGAFKQIIEFYKDQPFLILKFYIKYCLVVMLKFIKSRYKTE